MTPAQQHPTDAAAERLTGDALFAKYQRKAYIAFLLHAIRQRELHGIHVLYRLPVGADKRASRREAEGQ